MILSESIPISKDIRTLPQAEIAVPCPLHQTFTYLVPEGLKVESGDWVEVSFGRRQVTGLVLATKRDQEQTDYQIKPILRQADIPSMPADLMQLLHWSIRYYHAAPWDVVAAMLPVRLLERRAAVQRQWQLGQHADLDQLRRTPRQLELAQWLQRNPGASDPEIAKAGFAAQIRRQLSDKGLIQARKITRTFEFSRGDRKVRLDADQKQAINEVIAGRFQTYLLQGPTGSGKTEVYIEAAQRMVDSGFQVLILVPEISLTPQTEARFREQLRARLSSYHSGMTDSDRRDVYLATQRGDLDVVIGTRSAVFLPLKKPGLIVMDEEQDSSYKQQDGWRYHARSLAAVRASHLNIPLLLGSATPSLESLLNLERNKYVSLRLHQRQGNGGPPHWQIVDSREQRAGELLAAPTIAALDSCLMRGEQALVFINRRGYAPSFQCRSCRWTAECSDCSTRLTLHLGERKLICHHCGYNHPVPARCTQCGSSELEVLGVGTARL